MSSTALVLPIAGTNSPVGRAAFSMLLFEDLALVPLLFVFGAGGAGDSASSPASPSRALLVIAAMWSSAASSCRRLFAQAARTKSPELFFSVSLLVVILASLATACGRTVADHRRADRRRADRRNRLSSTKSKWSLAPLRGLALGVFLITVGMSIDFRDLLNSMAATAWRACTCAGRQGGRHRRVAAPGGVAPGCRGRDRLADGVARPKRP